MLTGGIAYQDDKYQPHKLGQVSKYDLEGNERTTLQPESENSDV